MAFMVVQASAAQHIPTVRRQSPPEHADVHSRRMCRIWKGERADEQAHGEANATKNGDAINLPPVRRPCGISPMTNFTAIHVLPKMPICLPRTNPGRDAEWNRRNHATQGHSGQRHADIGKGEDGADTEVHPRLKRILRALKH